MKRRILAFMLALAMLCPMLLTGCGKETETDDGTKQETTRATVSLNMFVVTDSKTTEEAKLAVEEEFNRITKSSFTTAVDIIFCTPDEYVEVLNNRFLLAEEAKNNSSAVVTTALDSDVVTEEELVTNENGVSVLKYPEINEGQIDIVFVQDFDHLYSLVKGEGGSKLENLNDHLSNTGRSKILTDVISDPLFAYTKIDNNTYAIPNNRIVGEYTYLLVNKDIVTGDKNGDGSITSDEINGAYYNFSDINTFFDCKDLIDYIKANKTDMVPVLEDFENPYVYNWMNDSEFSILGSKAYFGNQTSKDNDEYVMNNIFSIKEFTEFELLMKKYETEGYFAQDVANAKANKNFGVAVMSGNSSIVDEYGDNYYIKVISNPALTNENLFTSFFGVSKYTKNKDRAMEIITMLNTDSELRNVLQYGVEGVHYELDEEDRVERFNNDYIMDINTTGNVFIAYPEEDMADDIWERGVSSNLDMRIHALTGLWRDMLAVDTEITANLAAVSKTYKDRMDACTTVEELQAFFETAKGEVDADEAFVKATDTQNEKSPKAIYVKWYQTGWPSSDV